MNAIPRILLSGLVTGWVALVSSTMALAADPTAPTPPAAPEPSAGTPVGMTVRLELFVKDTHAAADFYTHILGFQCDSTAGPYIRATCGSVRIGICDQSTLPGTHHFSLEALKGQKGVGTEIVLEVENLDALYERVVKSGYAIREELMKRPWGLRDFRIVDPDGYYLRITEKTARVE